MLVIICILMSVGGGVGAWFGAGHLGIDPAMAVAIAIGAAANLSALASLLLVWRRQARFEDLAQRIERAERSDITMARAVKVLPARTKEIVASLESRLAEVERRAEAASRKPSAPAVDTTDSRDTLAEEIAAMTSAMNQTVARRAAEPDRVEQATKTEDAPAIAAPDDLASAVESLVARYTKEGRPRRLAAPSAVNDDPRPKDRMEDAKASLQSATNAAEKLATTLLRQTLEGNGLEVKLQPICRIANRRIVWQEATSQLGGKGLLTPADYLPLAGAAGLMPEHDTHLVRGIAECLRRTPGNMRLFFNLHPASLVTPGPIEALTAATQADPSVPQRLVIEFAQDAIKTMRSEEIRGLGTLARLGFDLSMDGVEDLRLEWKAMARTGFRFVKVPAHVLCGDHAGADVHPADLGALLDRYGLSLIAEGVDGEGTLLQLADHDVHFAQGRLFSSAAANDPRFARDAMAA